LCRRRRAGARGCSNRSSRAIPRAGGGAPGEITPGEAATIAGVSKTFVQTAGFAKERVAQGHLLRILTAGDDLEDADEDICDAEAIDDCDR
jgi:hypothetical protein